MPSLVEILTVALSDVLRSSKPPSEVRIEIRMPGDEQTWTGHSLSLGNSDSIQGSLRLAKLSFPGCVTRAVDESGRVMDFR
jgi:hypothetical protein